MFTSKSNLLSFIDTFFNNIDITTLPAKHGLNSLTLYNTYSTHELSDLDMLTPESLAVDGRVYVGKAMDFVGKEVYRNLNIKLKDLPETRPLLEFVPGHDYSNDLIVLTIETSLDNKDNPWDQNVLYIRYDIKLYQNEDSFKNASPYFWKDNLITVVRDEKKVNSTIDSVRKALENAILNYSRDFFDDVSFFARYCDTDLYLERYPESFRKIITEEAVNE